MQAALPVPVVLVTRPEPAARRFADQIADLGFRTVIAPLMRIVPVAHDPRLLDEARGLVFTSENAVRLVGPGRGRPAFCVGPRTGAQARVAGFAVTEGPGDAAGLIPMLAGLGPGWVHARGAHVAAELPVPGVVVYDQLALPMPPEGAAALAGPGLVILPLFSPRAARIAAAAVAASRDAHAAPLALVPISPAADAAWTAAWPPGTPAAPVSRVIADRPDAQGIRRAMMTLAATERPYRARVEQRGPPV